MTDEESKKKILARRARFIAAAVASAGMGIAGCSNDSDADPQPCLSPIETDSGAGDADTNPTPCLTPIQPDSGVDADADAPAEADATVDAGPDADPDTGPTPCLAPPPDDGGGG